MKTKTLWEVAVGNLGNVYSGNGRDAKRVFAEYCDQSKRGYGRAAGENVTLWKDSEPVKEFIGRIEENKEREARETIESANRDVGILDEAEQARRGEFLASILGLKQIKIGSDKGRYRTDWGTKTALGVYLVAKRIVEEGA